MRISIDDWGSYDKALKYSSAGPANTPFVAYTPDTQQTHRRARSKHPEANDTTPGRLSPRKLEHEFSGEATSLMFDTLDTTSTHLADYAPANDDASESEELTCHNGHCKDHMLLYETDLEIEALRTHNLGLEEEKRQLKQDIYQLEAQLRPQAVAAAEHPRRQRLEEAGLHHQSKTAHQQKAETETECLRRQLTEKEEMRSHQLEVEPVELVLASAEGLGLSLIHI
mgnify:CR=1 FL=1